MVNGAKTRLFGVNSRILLYNLVPQANVMALATSNLLRVGLLSNVLVATITSATTRIIRAKRHKVTSGRLQAPQPSSCLVR